MTEKNRIIIFDTTMRDGEQSPGASMSLEEKLQISRVFDELGVDVIEAGFPIASPGDFEAVTEISKTLKRSIPAGLARATKKDIDACHQALKYAKNFRIHTFISTSPLHMKHKLNKSPEEVLKDIQSGKFTKQWMDEHKSGQKNFLKMRQDLAKHPIEKVGKELRAMMPWIGKNKLVDKDKN